MLKIRGADAVVRDLLRLLGDAATLGQLQPGDQVSAGIRSSWTLHRCLMAIITDDVRDAQVSVDTTKMDFGSFSEWQLLNAVNAIRVNAGAPGMGVAIAFHEVWENYISRDELNRRGSYGPAHERALAVERDIAAELTAEAGGRVAAVMLGKNAAQGWVLDYESNFLVLTTRPEHDWPTGRFDARVHGRQFIGEYTIDGLTAGEQVAEDRLSDVLGTLRENPRATAQVAGQRTQAEDPEQAALRATAVRSAILNALNPDEEYAENGSIKLARDAKSPGTTLGALPAWVGPEETAGAEAGARVLVEAPEEG